MRPTDRVRPTDRPLFFPTEFHPSDTHRPSDSFTDHDRSNVYRAFFINARKTQSEPTIAYTSTVCTHIEPTPRASLRAVDIAGGGARPGRIELGRDRVGFDRGTRSRAAYLSVRRGDMQVRERIDRSIGPSIDRSGIGEATRGGGDERARRGLSMTGRGMSRG